MNANPNVLCVSLDSVRADDVSFTSNQPETTPNLRDLATESAVFENAISPSTWTLPVHSSVFTGQYPPEHGILDGGRELGPQQTLGERFSKAGYQTEAFYRNSWFDFGDILRGFTVGRDSGDSGPNMSGWRQYIKQGLQRTGLDDLAYKLYLYQQRPHEDERTVQKAVERLKSVSEPFCFFVHLNDAHYQYHPPKSLETRFSDASRVSLRWNQIYWQNRIFENKERYWTGEWSPRPDVSERMRELYRAEIHKVDELVGRLLTTLERRGVLKNTIVVVFGDHGDNFGEDGIYGHHFSTADSLIRVPLLIYDPTRQIESGSKSQLAQLNDIYPTILSLCDISATSEHSVDLSEEARELAYTYYHIVEDTHLLPMLEKVDEDEIPPKQQYVAWRSPRERGTWYPGFDDGEGLDDLVAAVRKHYRSLDSTQTVEGGPIEGEARQRLKRLGYLQNASG